MKKTFKNIFLSFMVIGLVLGGSVQVFADAYGTNFESFTLGSVDSQEGWVRCCGSFTYDVAVVSNTPPVPDYVYPSFGAQSLRISNAVTNGSYNDMTFSPSLVNDAGESVANTDNNPSYHSGGTRQPYFEAQWDFASTVPGGEQPGLSVVASPDRGDPGRMSWVQMQDTPTGLQVNFEDYQQAIANFVITPVASNLSRTVPHTIKVTVQFVDGASNDIVKVYVDGVLGYTGTTWEDYYRSIAQLPRSVDSLMFRTAGTAAPATLGHGFVIDNFSEFSGLVPVPPATFHVIKQVVNTGGGIATASSFNLHVELSGTDVAGSPAVGTSAPGTLYSLSPGTYSVSEDTNASYGQSFSGDCDLTGSVTLSSGDDKTCTIINTYIPVPAAPPSNGGTGGGGSALAPSPSPSPTPVPAPSPTPAPLIPANCERTSETPIPFTDISNHWAKNYIEALYRKCAIDGRTETLFMPDATATRAELVKIAFDIFGFEASPFEKLFADVFPTQWFAQYVISAAKLGVVTGYQIGNGLPFFQPDAAPTRAEALEILLKSKGITDFGNYQTDFADVTKGDWFYSLVAYAQNHGIVEGYSFVFNKSGPVSNFYSFPRLLGFSNVGKDVQNLKEIMAQFGYYKGGINMIYDSELENAMSAYQSAKGMKVTGQMGTITRSVILHQYLKPATYKYFGPNQPVTRAEMAKLSVLAQD